MQCFRTAKQSGRKHKQTHFLAGSLKNIGSKSQNVGDHILAPSFISWMTLGKLLNFSMILFGHLENKNSCEIK